MAVMVTYLEKCPSTTGLPNRGKAIYYCDTESSEKPTTFWKGSKCICFDTQKIYEAFADNVWTQTNGSGSGVPTSRLVSTTTPLAGGGDLSQDRTLSVATGTTSNTVCIGNDARLSDARTPTIHATSHKNGGSDEVATATAAANAIPKAGAAGQLGFDWLPAVHDGLRKPAFFDAASLTAVTAFATNTSYFVYLGRVMTAITTLDLLTRVTTQAATITWAEVGVFKGAPVMNGNASLTRLGFTNVAATFNSTGIKKTTVSLSGVTAGDELWLAFGSQATTPYQLRGGLADDVQIGWFATFAGRISTMSNPSTVTLAGGTIVPPWCGAKL